MAKSNPAGLLRPGSVELSTGRWQKPGLKCSRAEDLETNHYHSLRSIEIYGHP